MSPGPPSLPSTTPRFNSGLDLDTFPSWRRTAQIGGRPHHLWRPTWVLRSGGENMSKYLSFGRDGVSAEVGAPHEVTPIELVMLARMGATVMGKGSLVLF